MNRQAIPLTYPQARRAITGGAPAPARTTGRARDPGRALPAHRHQRDPGGCTDNIGRKPT